MPKSSHPAPYLAHVLDDYRNNLAQTGQAMGHAVLFLTICADQLTDEQRKARDVIQRAEADLAHINAEIALTIDALTTTGEH